MSLNDLLIIEGEIESDEYDYYESIQKTINGGMWGLQGSFGRTMMDAINAGRCVLGRNRAKDYYGNVIPSRDDVEEGTKGSVQYVVDRFGQDYADFISSI